MELVTLQATVREKSGKSEAKKVRNAGLVPAVVYGDKKEPVSISIDPRHLIKIFKGPLGKNTVIQLDIANGESVKSESVLAYNVVYSPIALELQHVDFLLIDPLKPIKAVVHIETFGVSPGVKRGGVYRQNFTHIEVRALPTKIPPAIRIDLGLLDLGSVLKVRDLAHEGFEILTTPEEIVVHIEEPAAVAATA
jgi:large subunit ribosomal protein L25